MSDWRIYRGTGEPHLVEFPDPPPWREFNGEVLNKLELNNEDDSYTRQHLAHGEAFLADDTVIDVVNAAIHLRRPLLGSGKTFLAYSIARELQLGPVLRWSITSSTKLADGLYHYDAIGRLQEQQQQDIGKYIHLGPLGAALLASEKPRVLLIDEIDKSDIDLPNDLLHIFEEGEFEIRELVRLSEEQKQVGVYYNRRGTIKVHIEGGRVSCKAFPIVIMTSNDERVFPPAFVRRCLRLKMHVPGPEKLEAIVENHLKLNPELLESVKGLIKGLVADFDEERKKGGDLATDQLLNAVYLASRGIDLRDQKAVREAVLMHLGKSV